MCMGSSCFSNTNVTVVISLLSFICAVRVIQQLYSICSYQYLLAATVPVSAVYWLCCCHVKCTVHLTNYCILPVFLLLHSTLKPTASCIFQGDVRGLLEKYPTVFFYANT